MPKEKHIAADVEYEYTSDTKVEIGGNGGSMPKDYSKIDHIHCFNQDNPPCGIKGKHRCCLCEEPMPKDYQEIDRIIKNCTNDVLALIPHIDGFSHSSINHKADEIIRRALTTYGNARVEEIIKIAEGMKVDIPTRQAHNLQSGFSKATRRRSRWKAESYNQALTDLIQAIKK